MADAFFHQGLAIEIEDRIPLLRVEGRPILVEKTPNGFWRLRRSPMSVRQQWSLSVTS